ncbi:hypothetical protein JL720_12281 [Aureococcus anophagefferens]|nr:hypothetical protein JL720_12281 [Aureococcus anophagefferens]
MGCLRLLLATSLAVAGALPSWSWDTIQNYVHCANTTGEWNAGALATLASKPFVVFEKNHKLTQAPVSDDAEGKIAASCAEVKKLSPTTDCYMYVESDVARSFYGLGHWVEANKATAALKCNGSYVTQTWSEEGLDFTFYAYDFRDAAMQANVTNGCAKDEQDAWAAGLNASVTALAAAIGPDKTRIPASRVCAMFRDDGEIYRLISNYPTTSALALCQGGMLERGGSMLDVDAWNSEKTCAGGPCLLDFHAQNAQQSLRNFNSSLANFLIGVHEHGYFGVGGGWSGAGESACDTWLYQYPEYSKSPGAPKSDFTVAKGSHGLNCTLLDDKPSHKDVFLGQYAAPAFGADADDAVGALLGTSNYGACVFWSDGTTTGNATLCPSE